MGAESAAMPSTPTSNHLCSQCRRALCLSLSPPSVSRSVPFIDLLVLSWATLLTGGAVVTLKDIGREQAGDRRVKIQWDVERQSHIV